MNSLRVRSSLGMFVVVLGCNPTVIESNDDDLGDTAASESEAGSSESSSTGESGTTTTDDETDDATSTTSTTDTNETTTTSTTDTDETTDTTETTGDSKHKCGWDPNNEYYFCGWEGEDPSMENPISCSEFEFPMVPGAPCDGKLNYIGCCDGMGDAWYCINGFIEYEVCGG